ncbi:GNAT family N-acetyltransferase [Microbacterium horticulturae]|uniref:GNAT family N-acetyltransferase n=1 Tax=Microbacterium horticulturae TaxID=3028316 RepID=A0ABY8C216_9MICO|nr:GNAT family N-acetyltransferase [Microbacterium sp. KACC 23027]WEG08893.1 GNAT family N-acetyltransferase [Microbacterium sp. KACC 23027]
MRIRDARPEDAAAIAAIYNDAVVHTTAVWNDDPVDVAEREAWAADRQATGLPVLVAVDDLDQAIGYASYGPWRPHDGYRHTVEHSVYVRGDQRGGGIGRALMEVLLARARKAGVHVMVAGIEAANTGSIALHERLGFAEVGRLPQVGAKFGRWLDLVFLQLTLDDAPAPGGGIPSSPRQENA